MPCSRLAFVWITETEQVVGNWGLKGPALFFVCLLYQLLNDAQKDT